jgi:hypothetical protein
MTHFKKERIKWKNEQIHGQVEHYFKNITYDSHPRRKNRYKQKTYRIK